MPEEASEEDLICKSRKTHIVNGNAMLRSSE